jgi:hypothetical protein
MKGIGECPIIVTGCTKQTTQPLSILPRPSPEALGRATQVMGYGTCHPSSGTCRPGSTILGTIGELLDGHWARVLAP